MECTLRNCDGSTAVLQEGAAAEATTELQEGAASEAATELQDEESWKADVKVKELEATLTLMDPSLGKWAPLLASFGVENTEDMRLLNMADAAMVGMPHIQVHSQ